MNPQGNPVYKKEGRTLQNTGRGGNDEGLITNTSDEGKVQEIKKKTESMTYETGLGKLLCPLPQNWKAYESNLQRGREKDGQKEMSQDQ